MATAAFAGPARASTAEHRFFAALAVAMLVVALVGFAPSFYWRGADRPALSVLLLAHGLSFTAFLLLFVAQTQLVLRGRTGLHRAFGVAGTPLLAAMAASGAAVGIEQALRGAGPPGIGQPAWLVWVLGDVVSFTGLVGASLWRRRDPAAHKRLMVLGVAVMMGPAAGRALDAAGSSGAAGAIGGPWLFALALALVAWDLAARGRLHRATALGVGFLALTFWGRVPIMQALG